MPESYKSEESFLEDYQKLDSDNKELAEKFMKNLMRLQRAENGIDSQMKRIERKYNCLPNTGQGKIFCSFCGKPQYEAIRIVAAGKPPSQVYICDACISLCNEIMEESKDEKQETEKQSNE